MTAPPPKKKPTSKVGWLVVGIFVLFLIAHCSHSSSHSSTTSSPTSTALATPTFTTTSLSPEQTQQQQQQEQERQQQQQEQQQEQERQQQLEAQRLDPNTYNAISPHIYALMLKDPVAHMSEKIIVYGVVTQFDTEIGVPRRYGSRTATRQIRLPAEHHARSQ